MSNDNKPGRREITKLDNIGQFLDFMFKCREFDREESEPHFHAHIRGILDEYQAKGKQVTFPCIIIHDENYIDAGMGAMFCKSDFE